MEKRHFELEESGRTISSKSVCDYVCNANKITDNYFTHIFIGSNDCLNCAYNKGINKTEKYVNCRFKEAWESEDVND